MENIIVYGTFPLRVTKSLSNILGDFLVFYHRVPEYRLIRDTWPSCEDCIRTYFNENNLET